jgi:peptidoglycan/LPS O-acetylase OafA/YrhL
MLHGVIPQFDHMGGNPPFWSLAREEYYYALYLPLLVLARKNLWAAVSLAFVISGLASAFTSAAAERYGSALLSLTLMGAVDSWNDFRRGVLRSRRSAKDIQTTLVGTGMGRSWIFPRTASSKCCAISVRYLLLSTVEQRGRSGEARAVAR